MGMRPRGWLTTLGVVGFVLGTACGGESVAAKQMQQLKAAYSSPSPVSPAMPDHIFLAQGDGTFLFLHFDKPVDKAEKVLYTGMAVPGVFSRADQERVEKQFGKGFTHFHRAKCAANDANACHGAGGVLVPARGRGQLQDAVGGCPARHRLQLHAHAAAQLMTCARSGGQASR
jgi:hypothetical protein